MAKLRTNHQRNNEGGGMTVRIGLFAAILGGLFWAFNQFMSGGDEGTYSDDEREEQSYEKPNQGGPSEPEYAKLNSNFYPTSTTGQIVEHTYYALSYNEEYEQAEWVAYELYKKRLYPPFVERRNNFRPDPKVRKASASDRDYRGSGYDRGHMAPAGDMNFDKKAMSESFYMSNMSPQIRNFNGGIWRELEENVRVWAKKFKHLYVVTGPVLTSDIREYIGSNEVAVPDMYYKVLLDVSEPEIKAIAYLMPNEICNQPISEYAVSIDEVEEVTGIDFFHQLLNDEDEAILESQFDPKLWPTSDKKYDIRVKKWNKRR